MSCHGDLERKCTEHVLSLQPTLGEADEFKKLNVGLLAADASWPPLLTNYLHRYMHSHNLYQVLKSKPEKLSNLVAFLRSRAELSGEDDIVKKLTQKCVSLITTAAQKWKQDGLLVAGGTSLRKSKTLRQVWSSHSDSFGRVEIRDHWGFTEIPDLTSIGLPPSSGSRKRAMDGIFPGDVKKVCRDREPTLSFPTIKDAHLNRVGVQSIHEREMAETSHASQCSQTDDTYDTIVVEHALDHSTKVLLAWNSHMQPSENRDDISDDEQLVHTAQETLGAIQQIERQPQTPPPAIDLAIQHEASTSRLNAPHPIQESLNEVGASLSNLTDHRLREAPPMVGQTPKGKISLLTASVRSESSPPDLTLIPVPPNLQPRFLESAVKKPAPRLHTQPRIPEKVLHSPHPRPPQTKGLAASLEHAIDTYRETALGAGQFRLPKEGQLALRKLQLLGQLLVPRRGGSGLWSMDVNDLMLQDSNKFCDSIARINGLPKVLELSFELLDLNMNSPYIIRKGDFQAFHSLKLAILNGLEVLLDANPGLTNFRILVTIPPRAYKRKGAPAPLQLGVTTPSQSLATGTPPSSHDSGPSPRSRPPVDSGNKLLRSHISERGSSCGSSASHTQIVVRIQETSGGAFSPRYPRAILDTGVTNETFFAWIAKKIGHHNPLGPLELEFCFKDALPPKRNVIARGNEEHFDYMKRDINYMCEQTAAQVPELFEFTILVMPRG